MGIIESKIRLAVARGTTLKTIPDAAEFKVGDLLGNALVLLFGKKEARTSFLWKDLETIPEFLTGKGWVNIGARHITAGIPGTLDGYLKRFVKRTSGGYIASILRVSGIIDVDPVKPAKVKLRNGWNK